MRRALPQIWPPKGNYTRIHAPLDQEWSKAAVSNRLITEIGLGS